MTTITGTSGDDTISGGNGVDIIYGGGGNDIISGGNGVDSLFGEDGNDQLTGDNGADNLTGGAGDDLLDGLSGFDTAYYSRSIDEYSFLSAAGYLHIFHLGGAGADGHDRVINVERLVFADRVINIGSGNNAPVAGDDHVFINEDTGTYSSGAASVKDNDFDFDGDPLTVTGGTFTGTYGTLTLNANGTYSYTLSASAQALALGENVQDSFNYTVSDNDGSDTGALVFHIAGVNDAPTANPDAATGHENQVLTINVLANDTDVDNGAVLTVTAASAPAGKGTATVVGNQVQFNPGTAFDHLAQGASEVVVISYSITDEHGATSSSTASVTVTGTNDGPVANPDTAAGTENQVLTIDALANDTDVDDGAVKTLVSASAPAGKGTASIVGNQVQFNPGTAFDHLAQGASEVVVLSYTVKDEHDATSSSTITVTVTGTNDGPVANPDVAGTGENSSVTVNVLANDTDADDGAVLTVIAASAPPGQGTASFSSNQVEFDPGSDFDYLAAGESVDVVLTYSIEDEYGSQSSSTVTITIEGRDEGAVITGTEDDDGLTGTLGGDTINGLGGNDHVSGLAGADQINGGDGFDVLSGDADNDVVDGGNDDDTLFGGDGNDQLFGQAGNDSLFGENGNDQLSGGDGNDNLVGGDGNDDLDGGDGDDTLSGDAGTNVLTGGAGNDYIVADSSDGAQTIDGGDGDDTIIHYYRYAASTIATGSGSDTIELAYADQGSAAITVTDFTAGAGGDMFRLSGADGALLSLLSGWDGNSNPFGSGFLRLQQSGADTLLQWDRNGTTGGATWETLVVFQDTDAGNFTEANFVPGYDPDGSAPAGQTITGTEDDDVLNGTIGGDTINGLGGNDNVSGLAGADQINGGDGFDVLSGDADNDVVDGGNDNDLLFGGDGNDQLFGQAGDDSLFGDNGDDQLSGGDGNDSLSGGDGDDTFSFQSASAGPDEITDFTSGADKIQVSASGFGGGLTAGGTVSLVSGSDPTASGASGQFLFDTDDGRLLWDADGTGGGEAVLVATLSNIPSLATSDFAVI